MTRCTALLILTLAATLSLHVSTRAAGYLIRPGDHLSVTVLGEPELTRRVVVDQQGRIAFPLLKELMISGMSTAQAADEITAQLRRFIKNPQVTVELLESAKMQVTVSGEVRNPGIYFISWGGRLMEAITAAGGYAPDADLSRVSVSKSDGSSTSSTVDLGSFLLGGDPSANIQLQSGDIVVVPPRTTSVLGTVTVLGAIRQAGQHPLTQGMTLREAVMLAGGPTEFADTTNVTLRREGSADPVVINYASASQGDTDANPALKPGDMIYIAAREQLGTYTIHGAVGSPGRYELKGRTTITEAIAIAGGVRERAKLREVRILRESVGKPQAMLADISDIMAGKAENLSLQNGDNVYVPASKQKVDIFRVASFALSLAWLFTRH